MGSWVDELVERTEERLVAEDAAGDAAPLWRELLREAVEEAALRCARQMPDNGTGDRRLAAAHASILKMLTDEAPRG